ncbi:MAG: hypothetical protein NTZ83_00945 [Candidatus Pacearchaeota archaeon]|nr:hypothetical protein [Candidatus Pacearchaeota archaeon]
MNNFYYSPLKCPEHPEEYLKFKYLGIYTPDDNDGMAYPVFNYCSTSNKIFDGKSMITLEEAALAMINSMYNKNYKLKDIKVTLDMSKLVKEK